MSIDGRIGRTLMWATFVLLAGAPLRAQDPEPSSSTQAADGSGSQAAEVDAAREPIRGIEEPAQIAVPNSTDVPIENRVADQLPGVQDAQDEASSPEEAPTDALQQLVQPNQTPPTPGPLDVIEVAVVHVSPDGSEAAASDCAVQLIGIEGRDIADVVNGRTDSDGVASFSVSRLSGADDWLPQVNFEDLVYSGPRPLSGRESARETIRVYDTTDDPSSVVASRLVIVEQLHEGYLTYEQLWWFENSRPLIYRPSEDRSDSGLEFVLPDGVEGIHVTSPDNPESVLTGDEGVVYRLPVGPPEFQHRGDADLVLRFSLPNRSSAHLFTQTVPISVRDTSILLPLVTNFSRHLTLDVDLQVPECGSGNYICFENFEPQVTSALGHLDRRAIHGGHGSAGASLLFYSDGWPAPDRTSVHVAAVAVILVILVCFGLVVSPVKPNSGRTLSRVPKRTLETERASLIQALQNVRDDYENGELPRSEFDLADLLLRRRLEATYTALGFEPATQTAVDQDESDSERSDSTPSDV